LRPAKQQQGNGSDHEDDCLAKNIDQGANNMRNTFLNFEDRPSDSPFVERVWRCHSERAGRFSSVASSHWEMVVTRLRGEVTITLRGPETKATEIECPADGDWVGIRFKLGTFMPDLPIANLIDRKDVTLAGTPRRSFWLKGSAWEYPDFENAETFVARLVAANAVARDSAVEAALRGERRALSQRSTQRHFLRATGISYRTFRQIQRARFATNLLKQGFPILDTVHEAGFFDQAHLAHSLRRLIGQTAAGIRREDKQLSFLYKTPRLEEWMITGQLISNAATRPSLVQAGEREEA
jgi:AraC-like DNA-binding protein